MPEPATCLVSTMQVCTTSVCVGTGGWARCHRRVLWGGTMYQLVLHSLNVGRGVLYANADRAPEAAPSIPQFGDGVVQIGSNSHGLGGVALIRPASQPTGLEHSRNMPSPTCHAAHLRRPRLNRDEK
ncbi:predicted protein [Chaetomium globosum CBS 148.51]|uniref:Uncharacterized protein n=1 Tax=Chaetomium globosum (strain ATCC 6205 / CBS 148.51 / DSM 1962 / NBRC 6347 / NRRL 1970) TaxID=306901 RepID=Q2HCK7_CHAGB|nr:uncharacterized protein CHGG_02047 [Chaetomium globosum CBS 148.51]EAQ93812.1 predicted protein [Chaetomium globosum CBS 148.51]